MGYKQIKITENETYADTYDHFFWLYYGDYSVSEITDSLISEFNDIVKYSEDYNHFWYAIAKAQWECKELNESVFEKVKDIIENKHDILLLKEAGLSQQILRKREKSLLKFLTDLKIERKAPKSRTRPSKRPAFRKGDCLTFKLENGNYGGAVVLEADYRDGQNLIAITTINSSSKPKKEDFESAEVLVQTFGNWNGKVGLHGYESTFHFKYLDLYEKVDSLTVDTNYDIDSTKYGIASSFKVFIIDMVNKQLQHEMTHKTEIERPRILDYIRK
jgi:hypothetical protein